MGTANRTAIQRDATRAFSLSIARFVARPKLKSSAFERANSNRQIVSNGRRSNFACLLFSFALLLRLKLAKFLCFDSCARNRHKSQTDLTKIGANDKLGLPKLFCTVYNDKRTKFAEQSLIGKVKIALSTSLFLSPSLASRQQQSY